METETEILEGKQKFWKETKNFRRKPKISEGNQKFWKENKIKFWKETKKIGIGILTPLGHRSKHTSLWENSYLNNFVLHVEILK